VSEELSQSGVELCCSRKLYKNLQSSPNSRCYERRAVYVYQVADALFYSVLNKVAHQIIEQKICSS
jgi:hypothetical protein